MKKIYILMVTGLILFTYQVGNAQDVALSKDLYGLNPVLYNGKYYTYSAPGNTKGNQFLMGPEYKTGSVQIKGKVYDSLLLNYDIFNQLVTLKFKTNAGNMLFISISDAWLEAFTIGNKHFKVLQLPGTNEKEFYQVIGKGYYKILYGWHKNMTFVSGTSGGYNVFSKAYRSAYLLVGNKPESFKKNNQFSRLFGKEHRADVAKFLRQHNINLKHANENKIQELIHYCNTLSK